MLFFHHHKLGLGSLVILFEMLLLSGLSQELTPKEETIPEHTLYFGWFFSESIAISLKTITDGYLKEVYEIIPEVNEFLSKLSIIHNISNPLEYYKKPLDPATEKIDPYYHVTAMYCGDNDCSTYYDKVKDELNKQSAMSLIGVFFTNKTFGIRVSLSKKQQDMFDEIDEKSNQFNLLSIKNYPGIEFIPQVANFTPSTSRAHVTLGCAPGIPAVQTGPDLLSIVQFENNENDFDWIEFNITDVGVLRQYFTKELKNETLAFVFYLDKEMVTNTTFNTYINYTPPPVPGSTTKTTPSFHVMIFVPILFMWTFNVLSSK